MNANNERDKFINGIIKELYREVQPQDSWEALRTRIDKKISEKSKPSASMAGYRKNVAFWHKVTFTLAACLVITLALLIYVLCGSESDREQNIYSDEHFLLKQEQLTQLSEAFSQVQELFNQSCPWMVINSGGKGEIGVDNQTTEPTDANTIVVLRLAVNMEGKETIPEYFDVITFSNQLVSFSIPMEVDKNINVALKPAIANNDSVAVEISTQLNSGSRTKNVAIITDNFFTSLVRVKTEGNWVNINATGRQLPNI